MRSPVAIVTGGAGFIGSHMVDLLVKEGFAVRIIDDLSGGHTKNLSDHTTNQNVVLEECDIRELDPTGPLFKGAKYVFHFAGKGDIVPSIENPIDYMSINVQGTVRVLECSRESNITKFVYAASSSCYGLADIPTKENHPIQPQYPYALSKYQGEQAVLHWHNIYSLPANIIRIFNAYGTRVKTTGAYGAVFGVFFKQKLQGKPFTVVGDGTQDRDFIYVTDVAKAFYAASLTNRSGEIFNIGAGNPQSVNKLVKLLGGDVIYVPRRPGEPDRTFADITKIKAELGWQPEVSFEEGVGKMVANIDYWKDAPLWDPDSIKKATKVWFKYMGKSEKNDN